MVATLGYAQTVYVLPVSLFGMAVSAAELPEMSRAVGDRDGVSTYLRGRLTAGLRNIAFFVVPYPAASSQHRSALGRGGAHGVRRHRGVDRVSVAAIAHEPPDWCHRSFAGLHRVALVRRGGGCGGRVGNANVINAPSAVRQSRARA